jgi:hypothetical protein
VVPHNSTCGDSHRLGGIRHLGISGMLPPSGISGTLARIDGKCTRRYDSMNLGKDEPARLLMRNRKEESATALDVSNGMRDAPSAGQQLTAQWTASILGFRVQCFTDCLITVKCPSDTWDIITYAFLITMDTLWTASDGFRITNC